ncbi:hypothetical protein [Pseudogracilibacillus sp. SO30301A]|uniref:hypothetical protein n=1 Tax=Pseudogracilibacillus sp. SO30301A TaxID=3098291 RepID=UPI003FA6D753
MRYKILRTDKAEEQLRDIIYYIADDSGDDNIALGYLERIETAIKVDWQSVSPREIQELTERMFDAANAPKSARHEYYNSFNKYNYRE